MADILLMHVALVNLCMRAGVVENVLHHSAPFRTDIFTELCCVFRWLSVHCTSGIMST